MKIYDHDATPLRLLYVINGLGPGGSERSLAELLPALIDSGVQPLVICLKHRNEGVERAVKQLACEVRFLTHQSPFARVHRLRQILSRERIDLVHTTLFEADILGRIAAAGTGVPVLTSFVNTGYDKARLGDPNIRHRRLMAVKAIDGWTARHLSTHFHAVTHAVKEDAAQALRLDPERIAVIERGRNPERLGAPSFDRRRQARRRLGLADDDKVVVNVGRQEYQKGQEHLIAALKLIREFHPNVRCLIVGREGHASAALRLQSEELVATKQLQFLGHRDDVPDILAAADIYIMPSLYEGCSGAVIEAMALGLPVIASDIPSLREVVAEGENGILVKPASPRHLAMAISRLIGDPFKAAALGHGSRARFLAHFTIDRSASRMIDLYRNAAAAGTKSPTQRDLVTAANSE
jgi:glycosyltransferase involved in cell wall biosynthesis